MSTGATTVTEMLPSPSQAAPASLPRLLAGISPEGAVRLHDHLALHGPSPLVSRRGRRPGRDHATALIDELDRAGLAGRGGGGFPTARKLRAVAGARGRPIVVVNGAEGEPASLKDRTLLEMLPHLMLDGAEIAGQAVGADEVIVCVCDSAPAALEAVEQAIFERDENRTGTGTLKVSVSAVPSDYVAGQESALINHLSGGEAKPTFTPPMMFEQGLGRRPTLINNVETLAHVALIARHGARWFRELGTAGEPGSALVTLSGPVGHPGVYEIEHGASLISLIDAAGGATTPARGALLGGYAGAWIAAEHLRGVALSREHLAAHGATLGAGVVLLLSEQACPVAETARLARWMAGQSARQCGPCEHGLDSLAVAVEELVSARAGRRAAQRIERYAALSAGRGACGHPDGAAAVTLSALEAFPDAFAEHARRGPCERCARAPELPLPGTGGLR